MKKREDYSRLVALALLLSVGILVAFQVYLLRESGRIQNVLAADQTQQIARGEKLFADNCATCHGDKGEGDRGPALNDRKFLTGTEDGRISSLISSGVPGTAMPSWSQTYGGPLTDEQIHDLVGFIRHWEATAQEVAKPQPTPDASLGQDIFASTCYACHGTNGQGTDRAPALNSKDLLTKFDDNWLRQTISDGRPAKGMPTWGKVLSPEQIDNVVAYIRSWEATAPLIATPSAPPIGAPTAALTSVAVATTVPTLGPTTEATSTTAAAAPTATTAPPPTATTAAPAPTSAPAAGGPVPNCGKPNCTQPGPALSLMGNAANGTQLYVQDCKKCHGTDGKGGINNPGSSDGTIPPLNPLDPAFKTGNFKLNIDLFIEHGSTPDGPSPVNLMDAWGDKHKLSPQQIADLIAYIINLNP
jgi:mono/diheme cytochrome c family protein